MRFRSFRPWVGLVAVLALAPLLSSGAGVPEKSGSIDLKLNADAVGPRELEDVTKSAIARDYAAAWSTLTQALDQNNADLLNAHFTGFARDNFGQRIADQRRAGVHTRYRDLGHRANIVFYSPDGLGVQLLDEAQIEIQIFDGDNLVSSTKVDRHYIALLTPAEVSWKVRILQDVPTAIKP